jgi:Bacterial Ig domain/Domain of unknown function DUF11
MYRTRRVVVGVTLLLAACVGDAPFQPRGSEEAGPTPVGSPVGAAPPGEASAAVTLAACTHHWASGTSGAWFTAANWAPASVPATGSTACIDTPGTYTVTMDPANDATPVNLGGLSVGGASGVQTLSVGGVGAAILNLTTGADVKASGVLSVSGMGGTVLTAPEISNAGTFQSTALCGGCGTPTVRANLTNSGTIRVSTSGLILDKANGAYSNTGTIDVLGLLTIPATSGNPSFVHQAGNITSTAANPNNGDFRMLAGTFTYKGGDALSTIRGLVTLEGANLVFEQSPAGTATFSMLPSAGGNTFTGNIGATHTVRMPLVGGAPTMASRTLTLVGNVTNAGTIEIQPSPGTNFPILAGTGSLTNTGTVSVAGTGNDSSRIAINFVNRGTATFNGIHLRLDQPSITYTNEGTINGTGELLIDGATLTNQSSGKMDIATRLINTAHLRGTGTNTMSLRVFSGSTVDPGFSPGVLTVGTLADINGGILNMELGGQAAGMQYDQIQATGQTTLVGGTLRVTTANNFEAGKCGQVFDIILHNSPGGIGQFGAAEGLTFSGGRALKIVYGKPAIKLVGMGAGQRVGIQTDPVSVSEGGNGAQYYVCLGQQPSANVTITPSPNAQVTVSPASLVFTPSDWELPKSFTVTAVDDQATEGAHTGSVSHTVSSTDANFNGFATTPLLVNITDNDAGTTPTAVNDAATTAPGVPVIVSVLANDTDPNGDPLTVSAVTQPANGTVQITGGGQNVTYTPPSGFSGAATFTYTVSDGNSGSATANVTVTVTTNPNPPPPPPPARTRADLGISVRDTPDPALPGQQVNYVITITNRGPTASQPTIMRVRWTDRTLRAIPGGPCLVVLSNPTGHQCNVPAIPANGSMQIQLQITGRTQRGVLVLLYDIVPSPLTSDPNLGNNVAVETTTWTGGPRGGPFLTAAPSAAAQASATASAGGGELGGWKVIK